MHDPVVPTPVFEINVQTDRVKQGIQNVRRVTDELKKKREMYKDALEGDAEYHRIKEEMDAKRKELNGRRKTLEATGDLFTLKQEIKNLQGEKKEEQLSLSDWLEDYKNVTKQTTIEVQGDVLKIESNYKLKKKP